MVAIKTEDGFWLAGVCLLLVGTRAIMVGRIAGVQGFAILAHQLWLVVTAIMLCQVSLVIAQQHALFCLLQHTTPIDIPM
jgi:hypothetical protein